MNTHRNDRYLVIGANGKTGRRVAERLWEKGVSVRSVSRSTEVPFDWANQSTWAAALDGIDSAYVSYQPDLALPGAVDAIRAFLLAAKKADVKHVVLLSGRGEEEAEIAEKVLQDSGLDWTVLRASWFMQNFSENYMRDELLSGSLTLPVGPTKEPFIDVDDIADVAVAALTETGHRNKLYELTGPELFSFSDAVSEIARATDKDLSFNSVSYADYEAALREQALPEDVITLLRYLFVELFDGRNASVAHGVEEALGRKPRRFADFARKAAIEGIWEGQS
ncbi:MULTISPECIES: NAD(P)H-binding protein [Brucella/Ochrobactrum group]|uniref:dTDP-4-dehydrorhamnose reductase n=1 Tax=Brucella anthropi (strain ATCC 49188 / DSM 6882 / CCUG 24695 / JCM 21032 / LMG 3331 / NBRC 15819 / NCTC 12168 / Alc 37) TaxID=439375 RepID=A6WZI6_BRUA4|nr:MULTISPECIES: NAD(P)H-binding protein [Brucella/Ochrobactrum group]ABS14390.1 dTDP-4-dehydrorhamnose reductase [Brucella anthropi ATCC 49188]AIK44900.1 rmlD substrate binding domain protein [Brucella anthropi]KAB2731890.1 NAD(P)H-binding protein [Brucella anthropi]KAB2753408.1 NAD(P)H-binding protein [Brucella anthropi]KAB2760983.1 NAD(P)H-binding protein [Brucella anthropi]